MTVVLNSDFLKFNLIPDDKASMEVEQQLVTLLPWIKPAFLSFVLDALRYLSTSFPLATPDFPVFEFAFLIGFIK